MNEKPLYNTVLIAPYIEYLGKYYPDVDIDSILSDAGMTNYQLGDKGHWFTQRQVDLFYESLTKNKVAVLDTRDNTTKLVSKQDYIRYDYYESCTKGNEVAVLDIRDNITKMVSKADYRQYDYYESTNNGVCTIYDISSGKYKKVSKDELESNTNYVGVNTKIIDVYDDNGCLQITSYGKFYECCKEYNLSFKKLTYSYKHNGEPIFTNIKKHIATRLKNTNQSFQIGWYAKIRNLTQPLDE